MGWKQCLYIQLAFVHGVCVSMWGMLMVYVQGVHPWVVCPWCMSSCTHGQMDEWTGHQMDRQADNKADKQVDSDGLQCMYVCWIVYYFYICSSPILGHSGTQNCQWIFCKYIVGKKILAVVPERVSIGGVKSVHLAQIFYHWQTKICQKWTFFYCTKCTSPK